VIEPIVLAQDFRDRHFVLGEQGQIREVHLPGQRMLALLRQADLLVRLIQQLALPGRAHDRQKTYDRRRDEKQRDDEEAGQQLRVDGRSNTRHPSHRCAKRRSTLDERGEFFEFASLFLH
jgi:hypothetical protein